MWSNLKPLCSLYEWSQVMGVHPYLLAQIDEPHANLSSSFGDCENPFYQYAHQGADTLAREDIAEALLHAEELIRINCGTNPAPRAESEELLYPRMHNLRWEQMWYGDSGRLKSIRLALGNLISMGVYSEVLAQAGAAIVGSDPAADGFNTFATVTAAVPAGTIAEEVSVYFTAADCPNVDRSVREIRPVNVSISGLVATITFPLVLVVRPVLFTALVQQGLNATDASIYATTVDVYRRTIDLSQSGTLIWENWDDCLDPPCTFEYTAACFHPIDKNAGYIAPIPADWNDAAAAFELVYPSHVAAPDRVIANSISGIPRLTDGRMAELWRQAVAKLATALLPNKTCGCATADVRLFYYRSMPVNPATKTLEISQSLLDEVGAAFGVLGRGAVEAYTSVVKNSRFRVYEVAVG